MISISMTVLICVLILSVASLRTWRRDALGIPLVVIGTFAFIYVVQPVQLLWTGTNGLFLTDWQMSEGLLMPALMLACFMWGWLFPKRPATTVGAAWDWSAMWRFGFGCACLGVILYLIFVERSGGFATAYSQAHGHAMAWEGNTAYLYYGPWLILSGSSIMIFGEPKSRSRRWLTYIPYGFMMIFLAQALLGGDRGPLFSGVSVAVISYSIARRKRIELWRAVGALLVVGSGIILVFANREKIHFGGHESEQVQSTAEAINGLVGTDENEQEHDSSGQEFLVHAVEIATVDQTGKLGYGVFWVELLVINPIPRLLWPEKAYPAAPGISPADIREHTSFAIAGGSAPGIVADLYTQFHLLSTIFFFFLGFAFRRLFIEACKLTSPVATIGYVMVFAVSLNMFAQGFAAVFTPLGYSVAPVFFFSWLTRESRKRAKQRQQSLILNRVAALHRQAAAMQGERWSS